MYFYNMIGTSSKVNQSKNFTGIEHGSFFTSFSVAKIDTHLLSNTLRLNLHTYAEVKNIWVNYLLRF